MDSSTGDDEINKSSAECGTIFGPEMRDHFRSRASTVIDARSGVFHTRCSRRGRLSVNLRDRKWSRIAGLKSVPHSGTEKS